MTQENNQNDSAMVEVDGTMYPMEEVVRCADGEMRLRDECALAFNDEWYPSDEVVELRSGDVVPSDHDEIVQLHNGDYEWADNAICVHGDWYPDDEACYCDWCNDAVHNDDTYYTQGGSTICPDCRENDCFVCDRCGDVCHNDDEYYASENEDEDPEPTGCCQSCRRPRTPPAPRLIVGYSDRSANHMVSESTDRLKFGIELEVESSDNIPTTGATFARQHLSTGYAVFKTDGSLGAGGFEIVTRPDSVAVHIKNWDQFFTNSPGDHLRSWGTGRCGMHVHITRAALSQLQIGKMLCFLNDPFNRKVVEKIAGRKCEGYCKVHPKKVGDARHYDPDRYVALNLTNSRTVEVRIFRGTLNRLAFFKNLEFCKALVEFTAPAQRSVVEATNIGTFLRWVSYKEYPNLYGWLVQKSLITDRRPKKRGQ